MDLKLIVGDIVNYEVCGTLRECSVIDINADGTAIATFNADDGTLLAVVIVTYIY